MHYSHNLLTIVPQRLSIWTSKQSQVVFYLWLSPKTTKVISTIAKSIKLKSLITFKWQLQLRCELICQIYERGWAFEQHMTHSSYLHLCKFPKPHRKTLNTWHMRSAIKLWFEPSIQTKCANTLTFLSTMKTKHYLRHQNHNHWEHLMLKILL